MLYNNLTARCLRTHQALQAMQPVDKGTAHAVPYIQQSDCTQCRVRTVAFSSQADVSLCGMSISLNISNLNLQQLIFYKSKLPRAGLLLK